VKTIDLYVLRNKGLFIDTGGAKNDFCRLGMLVIIIQWK